MKKKDLPGKGKKILVLGGGFGGVETAIKLRKYGYETELISDREYLFIYPISIWVPVKKIKFEDVKIDLSVLANKHGFKVHNEKISEIDVKNKTVTTNKTKHNFDYLFIAVGMNKVVHKGMEHTLSICGNPDDSVKIKDKLEELVRQGHGKIAVGFAGNPKDPTATAVRGGPAFELLFNFSHYLKKQGLRDKFELNFFAPMEEPGKRMGKNAYGKTGMFFKRYKIKTSFGKKIKEFTENSVVFEDNSELQSDLTVFIAGGEGHDIIKNSDLPKNDAGFIKINELCRVSGLPYVYAVGDAAAIIGHPWASKQGHIAEVMADVSTYNFNKEMHLKGKRKSYWEKLHIICVMDSGDGAAFIVRKHNKDFIIPLPVIGHWMKKGWGFYYRNSKLKHIPRIPGM